MPLKLAVASVHAHTGTTRGQRGLTFELGGGLLPNVFHIFCFPSTSADRTSVWAAVYWSQRQQTQHFAKPSAFYPPSSFSVFLLACIFIAFPHSPHAVTIIFFIFFYPLPFFLVHFFTFTGSSPAFGPSLRFLSASFPLCSPMVRWVLSHMRPPSFSSPPSVQTFHNFHHIAHCCRYIWVMKAFYQIFPAVVYEQVIMVCQCSNV